MIYKVTPPYAYFVINPFIVCGSFARFVDNSIHATRGADVAFHPYLLKSEFLKQNEHEA